MNLIDDEARLYWGSTVNTKHQSWTNLAFMCFVPGDDQAVCHICIQCIITTYTKQRSKKICREEKVIVRLTFNP